MIKSILASFLETTTEPIYILNQSAEVVYANQPFAQKLGYTTVEAIGLHAWDINRNADEQNFQARFAHFKSIGNLRYDSVNSHKDGTQIHVKGRSNYFEHEGQGYAINFVEFGDSVHINYGPEVVASREQLDIADKLWQEIAEHKRNQQQLAEQKNLLEGIIQATPAGIIVYSAIRSSDGEIIDFKPEVWNQEGLQILKPAAPDFENKTLLQNFPSLAGTPLLQAYLDATTKGESFDDEVKYGDDGLDGWYQIRVNPLADGFIITFFEVTDTKMLLYEVEAKNQLLQAVFDAAPFTIHALKPILDEEGQIKDLSITLWNQRAEKTRTDDLGDNLKPGTLLSEVFPAYKENEIAGIYAEAWHSGQAIARNIGYNADGVSGTYSVTVVPFRDGLIITSHDITPSLKLLKEAEAHNAMLQAVLDGAASALLVAEPLRDNRGQIFDFLFTHANQIAASISGISPEEMIGQTMLGMFPSIKDVPNEDGSRPSLFASYVEAAENGTVEPYDLRYNVDGYDGWYRVAANRVPGSSALIITYTDITALRETTERTALQNELMTTILNNTRTGLVVAEAVRDESGQVKDFYFLNVNRTTAQYGDMEPQDLIGSNIGALFPSHDLILQGDAEGDTAFSRYARAVDQGQPEMFKAHFVRKGYDGWFQVSAHPVQGTDSIVITYSDVSALQKATLELAAQNERLQTVLDSAFSGILMLEAEHNTGGLPLSFRVVEVNKTALVILGKTGDEMMGRLMQEIFPNFASAGFQQYYIDAFTQGIGKDFVAPYTDDKINAWFHVSAIRQGENGLVLTFNDISVTKAMQLEQDQLLENLRRSNAELEQFAYIASHDMREPLRMIYSYMQLLERGLPEEVKQLNATSIDFIKAGAVRMRAMIDDLLSYSRASFSEDTLEEVDLADPLNVALGLLDKAIEESGAVIKVSPLPKVITGNDTQIAQLFLNLISNALKFRRKDSICEIGITCKEISGGWQISVSDNGIGIDIEHHERIFSIFKRLHGRDEYAGTGIGLAIVRRIVSRHGGQVWMEHNPGGGSVFCFTLPKPKL